MHRIDGPGATVDNKFTEGDPVGGIQATIVTDDWLNNVQEEVMSVLSAGGVPPVKGAQNQLLQSLYNIFARINSPMFTGTPGTNSTPPLHDNSARLANTNFVYQELQSYLQSTSESVAGLIQIATTPEVTSGANDSKAVTPLKLATKISAALMSTAGYNRTYVDKTSTNVAGTTYTNTNSFPITVVVSIVTQPGVDTTTVQVGSTIIFSGDLGVSGMVAPFSFMVGNGQTYKVSIAGGVAIQKWVEMI